MSLATLVEKLSVVRDEDVRTRCAHDWLRTKPSFKVLGSALLCVRDSYNI